MRHKGYTLIEILIVIALFTLIFSIALPSLGILNRTREGNELKEIKRDLIYTRNKAIVDCKSIKFRLDYENNGYIIEYLNGEKIKSKYFQYGIKLMRNPKLLDYAFTSNGTPSNSDTLILEDSKKNRYEIAVTPATGKITLRKVR